MNTNSYIVFAIIPLILIVPFLLRRRIREVFSKNWPWVILGVLVTLFVLFVRDIPLTRQGMAIVKDPELHFDSHINWRTIDPNIGQTWEGLWFGKGNIVYDNNFTINDYNNFIKKLNAAYVQNNHAPIAESEIIKQIVQVGQNIMVTHIVPADLCPITLHLMAIAMMFSKFRQKLGAAIGIWAVLGGLLATSIAPMEPWAMNPNIMEIIFGDYVGAHFLQIIIGCMALIVAPKITWKDAIKSIIFIFLMMAYIAIIYWMTNITMQTTGIAEGDWRKGGEYNIVPTVLNMNNQSIHAIRFVGWMIFIVAQLILTYIIILCQKADKKYCNKFPEGFIYKYTKPFFTKFQKSFKINIKQPIIKYWNIKIAWIIKYWKKFWETDEF